MTRRHRHSAGLTMIELMVVLALATVGLLGFVSMQRVAISGNLRSRSFNEALGLAQDRLERYSRTQWGQLVPGVTLEPAGGINAPPLLNALGLAAPEGMYARTTTVAIVGLVATVTVQVQFRAEDGSNHGITVSTMRGPN